ncbi:Sel1 repeat-containing protein 1-like protein [Sarcoptes scabiei]|nr:Sel1 repeat-containing protein 1-like protein [Sarcoptes scabiei]
MFTLDTLNSKVNQKRLTEWINSIVQAPYNNPRNFNKDWIDGIRLCAVCEAIEPGCCPRFDLLDPQQPLNNINLALCLVKNFLNISVELDAKQLSEGRNGAKLVRLLLKMKARYDQKMTHSTSWNDNENGLSRKTISNSAFEFFQRCHLTGMGIFLGVRGHRTRFNIDLGRNSPNFSFVIEIIGPYESFCSETIEIDRKSNQSFRILANDSSDTESDLAQKLIIKTVSKWKKIKLHLKIPLFYEIVNENIKMTYVPLFAGQHRISFVWQGNHIFGSPFYAKIEETEYSQSHLNDIGPKFTPGLQYPMSLLNSDKKFDLYDVGIVIRKKILNRVIISNGREYNFEEYLEQFRKESRSNAVFNNSYNQSSRIVTDSSQTSSLHSSDLDFLSDTPKHPMDSKINGAAIDDNQTITVDDVQQRMKKLSSLTPSKSSSPTTNTTNPEIIAAQRNNRKSKKSRLKSLKKIFS